MINVVETSKFLGIIISSSLDWTDHINLISQKVSRTIGVVKCVRNKLPENILRSLYFTLKKSVEPVVSALCSSITF